MLRLILPIVLLLVGLGAGVGAGLLLRPAEPAQDESAAGDPIDPETETKSETKTETETETKDAHSDAEEPHASQWEYARLNNQFVVPIVRNGTVRSLVVMSLTVEVGVGHADAVSSHEPRLRDSFLQVLFAHANAGGFDGGFTQASAMDPLRAGLRDAARQVLGTVVRDVLIVDITRQDA